MVIVTLPQAPVPVFPLQRVFLFPHQVLPLHVFEERYRALVDDLLDATGRFVLGTIRQGAGKTAAQVPELTPVAGYGEIVRHEKLPDGRYLIWLLGLTRVRIEEAPSDRPYRMVRCLPFVEQPATGELAASLSRELHAAAEQRIRGKLPLPPETPPELLADLLVQALEAPPAVLERVFGEPSIPARARLVLQAAAAARPVEDDDQDSSGTDDANENAE